MENTIKDTEWKKVMRISSKSSFPIFLYCVLDILLINLLTPKILKILRHSGFILTDNFSTFLCYIIIFLVIFPIIILAFQLISKKENRVSLKSGFCMPKKSFLWILKWLVISFSVSMIVTFLGAFILSIISAVTGVDVTGTNMFFASASLLTVPTYLVDTIPTLLFAPILEEVLFRGVIYKNNEKLGFVFASITSSLLFGFWHMTLSQLILASILGFFSCYMYRETKSIFPSMILHFLNNIKSVFGVFVLRKMNITSLTDTPEINEDFITNYMTEILLLIALLFLVVLITILGFVLLVITLVNKKREKIPVESTSAQMITDDSQINYSCNDVKESVEELEIVEEKKMSGFKKMVLYYCSPVTIITHLVLIYGLVTRII